ncbi:unnamed protein product [Zymoseptoria tritici ST99CH_3D7]|uniref:Uncharacterized protein n=1 Tax=Zymoseptoria tritici (strain ST99CH_3D7) TaxID=1276538 RepID=A0A1X7RWY9_ZYMT9|nr:unnamed protein product [Zymoseptoria tritici ST99CH_3D7]
MVQSHPAGGEVYVDIDMLGCTLHSHQSSSAFDPLFDRSLTSSLLVSSNNCEHDVECSKLLRRDLERNSRALERSSRDLERNKFLLTQKVAPVPGLARRAYPTVVALHFRTTTLRTSRPGHMWAQERCRIRPNHGRILTALWL